MSERFVMNTPNDWGFPITDTVTKEVYACNSNMRMKDLCKVINKIAKENEELKQFQSLVFDLIDGDVDRLARLSELQQLKEELKE